jgi:hypothetical protein
MPSGEAIFIDGPRSGNMQLDPACNRKMSSEPDMVIAGNLHHIAGSFQDF